MQVKKIDKMANVQWGIKLNPGIQYRYCGFDSVPVVVVKESNGVYSLYLGNAGIDEIMLLFLNANESSWSIKFRPKDSAGQPTGPLDIAKMTIRNITGASQASARWEWDDTASELEIWFDNFNDDLDQVDFVFDGTVGTPNAKFKVTVKRDTTQLTCA